MTAQRKRKDLEGVVILQDDKQDAKRKTLRKSYKYSRLGKQKTQESAEQGGRSTDRAVAKD